MGIVAAAQDLYVSASPPDLQAIFRIGPVGLLATRIDPPRPLDSYWLA
jgi:hypothetical protein